MMSISQLALMFDRSCPAKDSLVFGCSHLLSHWHFSKGSLNSLFQERRVGKGGEKSIWLWRYCIKDLRLPQCRGGRNRAIFLSLHDYTMLLFMAIAMIPSAALSDFGGRKYRRFCSVQLSPIFGSSHTVWRPCFCVARIADLHTK